MKINYNGRRFKALHNTPNGAVDSDMIFQYRQEGAILTCEYHGLEIRHGHLLGQVDTEGIINMSYHQIQADGTLMTGKCRSTPSWLEDGRIQLNEEWQWTSGDLSKGSSVLVEVKSNE